MEKCDCFEPGCYPVSPDRCNGTQEREACGCGGDKLKCDFYPSKREVARLTTVLHKDTPIHEATKEPGVKHCYDAVQYLKAKKLMCDTESDEGCTGCAFYKALPPDEACDEFDINYPDLAPELVMRWLQEHPRYPTWNKWLHNFYYKHNSQYKISFMD